MPWLFMIRSTLMPLSFADTPYILIFRMRVLDYAQHEKQPAWQAPLMAGVVANCLFLWAVYYLSHLAINTIPVSRVSLLCIAIAGLLLFGGVIHFNARRSSEHGRYLVRLTFLASSLLAGLGMAISAWIAVIALVD